MQSEPKDNEISPPDTKLFCGKCRKFIDDPDSFEKHRVLCEKRTKRYFRCVKCRMVYSSKGNLNKHMVNCTATCDAASACKIHFCKECHRRYITRLELENHLRAECGKNSICKFYCDHCLEGFRAKTILIQHLQSCARRPK